MTRSDSKPSYDARWRPTHAALLVAVAGLAVLAAAPAAAVGTKSWSQTVFRDFDDEGTKGVLVSSRGGVRPGYATRKVEIKVPFVRSSVTAPDGTVYLGTGDGGEDLRV